MCLSSVSASARSAAFCLLASLCLSGCSLIFGGSTRYLDYPVRPGDTLYTIGQRFGVSVKEIEGANDIDDPRSLYVGQILHIPFRGKAPKKITDNEGQPLRPDAKSERTVRLNDARRFVGKLQWPVPHAKIASSFGTRWGSFHEGLDLSAPIGTPILAAHSGTVVYAGDGLSGYGNMVVLRASGLLSVYAHNDRNTVKRGEFVEKGDLIAEVGETGHATGPHCHFETRVKDKNGKNAAIDPLVFFPR